jgi:hypothetical protein
LSLLIIQACRLFIALLSMLLLLYSQVVFISSGGGWKEEGAVVSSVDMAQDFERYEKRDYTGRQVGGPAMQRTLVLHYTPSPYLSWSV